MSGIVQDKGFAWCVMLTSFTINVIEASVYMSPAVYLVAWDNTFDVTKAQLGVAGSLFNGISSLITVFVGPIIARYGCRPPCMAGTLVCAVGFLGTIFAPNIVWIYFTYGIVGGVGVGFLGMPPIVGVQYYFKKKRTFALGTSLAGHSVGALLWLPVLTYMIEIFGWRGAMLLHIGLLLQILVLASFYRPIDLTQLTETVNTTPEKEEDKSLYNNNVVKICSETPHSSQVELSKPESTNYVLETRATGQKNDYKPSAKSKEHVEKSYQEISETSHATENSSEITADKLTCSVKGLLGIFKFSLLTKKAFIVYIFNIVITELVIGLPYKFTPIRALEKGIHKDDIAFVLSTLFVVEMVMRVVGSIFGNLSWVNRSVMSGVAISGIGIMCIASCFAYNFLSYAVIYALFGFFSGSYFSVVLTLMTDVLGVENVAEGFSLLNVFNSIGIFVSLPLAGFIIDMTGNYDLPFYIYGSLAFIPALIYIIKHSLFDSPTTEACALQLQIDKGETKEMKV